ncbi:hypothetical protein FisN_4Hh103 [Fistulifera solaris]|uniref:WW domain-containing protein n=1 Tax=Fistulifera solaris TaxID=1519565 RepID=A0A1Z5KEN9_FISSO|nr:hypothetical protein FisN_4Hh103 [Fistulifera solaris]|eukprot:GAX24585.1 hypothetical protein FisN_4Hh103 [Fistulifera solaris]
MGNQPSSQQSESYVGESSKSSDGTPIPAAARDDKERFRSFPGSALLEKTFCGSIDTTDPSEYQNQSIATRLMHKADVMCIRSPRNYGVGTPVNRWMDDDNDILEHSGKKPSISSALLARALVNEVTDNPKTMNPAQMAARERKLLKAQQAARSGPARHKPIGKSGAGVGPPSVLNSVAYALTGQDNMLCIGNSQVVDDVVVSSALQDAFGEHGGRSGAGEGSHLALEEALHDKSPFVVTIALCLSRRSEDVGHPDSITRQSAFDFNEVQDREYKYVSSTDAMGWRAGGGEKGGPTKITGTSNLSPAQPEPGVVKKAHRDDLHLPIIHLDCGSAEGVGHVIHSLASGDIFIPHMAVLPDSLAVHGSPLPDLMLRWQCDRNEDVPVDEWHNWCLEFIHNQIYEYFHQTPVRPIWMPRPFNVTLAKAAACGCTEVGGFVAQEVTNKASPTVPASFSSKSMPQIKRLSSPSAEHSLSDGIADEKKNDDIPISEEVVSVSRKSQPRQSLSSTIDEPGVSGNFSVAPSGTTVMHRNLSHLPVETKDKRLFSDDDWDAAHTQVADPPGEKVTASPQGYASFQTELQSGKMKTKDNRLNVAKEANGSLRTSSHHKMQLSPPGQSYNQAVSPKVDSSDSYSSLAYSVGNSSGHTGIVSGYTSNIGQYYADTPPSRRSSAVAKSLSSEEEYSIQESSSSLSVVPTDEELYAIGWAKALDPKSGNFYYFTLDRKKIMWDNPLPRMSVRGSIRGL